MKEVRQIKIERPKRMKLSEKEVFERTKKSPEREEAIRAAIREGAHQDFRRDEIVAASEVGNRLDAVLDRLKKTKRIVLLRNNHPEAVLLPIEEYEELMKDLDHLLLASEIAERKARDEGKRIPWETIKANSDVMIRHTDRFRLMGG